MRINSVGTRIFFLSILLNGNLLIKDNYIFAGTDHDGVGRMPLSNITTWEVSSRIYGWTDSARFEPHTADPNDHREILVKVFYPSEAGTNNFANLGYAAPVILFSPGMSCVYDDYLFLINDLVSNGYVVAGVNHPYISGTCVFPDGHVVYTTNNWLGDEIVGPMQGVDLSFCIDKVTELNTNDTAGIFTGKFDLNKIGAYGHSQGGMAMANCMVRDNRVKAIICFDTSWDILPYPNDTRPLMIHTAGTWNVYSDIMFTKLWFSSVGAGFCIQVASANHMSYLGSAANAFRTMIAQYNLAFFNVYFKTGSVQDILNLQTTYPSGVLTYKPAN